MLQNYKRLINEKLGGRRILVMSYCHADIAWYQTRRWHIDRYMKVLEDVFYLTKKYPDFKWFMDSYIEFIQPCFEARPDYIPKFRKLLKQGKVAITCGHYGNLRMTEVGNETILRNIIIGMEKTRELFPSADLSVYANLDVAIGHTQVPQILNLAGIKHYLAWRPEVMLDKRGIPRTFIWKGLSDNTVLVRRHPYVDFIPHTIKNWKRIDDKLLKYFWESHLNLQAEESVKTISMCTGMDDERPLKYLFGDIPKDFPSLIKAWNKTQTSRMEFATPLDLFRELDKEKNVPTIEDVLDPAEVCYNITFGGKNGIWWLRELSDRILVNAETFSAIASLTAGFVYPQKQINQLWENLLSCCPHAVQVLCTEDYEERHLKLKNCVSTAENIFDSATRKLFSVRLPHHSDGIVIINPSAIDRNDYFELTYPNCDLSRGNLLFLDSNGKRVKSQLIEPSGHNSTAEFILLLNINVPSCGFVFLTPKWEKEKIKIVQKKEIKNMTVTIESGAVRLKFYRGHITEITDKQKKISHKTTNTNGFLEPVSMPYKGPIWGDIVMKQEPLGFKPDYLCVTETGPLRWRIIRKGKIGNHTFKQTVDLFENRRIIEAKTEFFASPDVTYLGLSVPIEKDSSIIADIPFGIEERNIDDIPYGPYKGLNFMQECGSIETKIRGIFWARRWVRANKDAKSIALIAIDGDRYYWKDKSGTRIVHFLARIMEKKDEGWEAKLKLGTEPGYHEYKHALLLGDKDTDDIEILNKAEAYCRPMKWYPVKKPNLGTLSFFSISPSSVMLSSLYREGKYILLRAYNCDGNPATAEIRLPFGIKSAKAVDLQGKPLRIKINFSGRTMRVQFDKWQIITVKITER